MTSTRCDLHLHSSASRQNDDWYSTHFDCPESYADPIVQYQLCKKRGMDLVTLTDHDSIDGGLLLLDRPDFFLSEEVTTTFPESGCQIHVLAWNITPQQHERIQNVRSNVYELVDLLTAERIAHACAHPLLSSNWTLDADTLEKMLLLFPVMESRNGLTDIRLQRPLDDLLAGIDEHVIAKLSQRHGIVPRGAHPHRKVLTAGSDDHAHRRSAANFMRVDGRSDPVTFLGQVLAGEASVHGDQADLNAMHLTVSRTTYGFLQLRRNENEAYRDPFLDLVDVVAGRERGSAGPLDSRGQFIASMLMGAARKAQRVGAEQDVHKIDDLDSEADDARVMAGIARVNDGLVAHAIDEISAAAGNLDMYQLLGGLRDLAGAVGTVIPYLFAADHFAAQHEQARRVMGQWTASPWPPMPERLAIFSDSLENTDGVASSCRRFAARAARQGKEVRVPYCGPSPATDGEDGGTSFSPLPCAATYSNPLYPSMSLHVPSLLGTIDWLWRERITHVDLATPGPMGLLGLIGAKLLRLPVTASYHTEIPELALQLTDSQLLYTAACKYVSWFYGLVDRVFVFSEASRTRLGELGVRSSKIELMPVTIEPTEFSPAYASTDVFDALGVGAEGRPIVLSVGRLSPEKNLPLIIDAVAQLQFGARPPILVIVGDGPSRGELESVCEDKSFVRLVGLQRGETLSRLYASADAFVFASRIDTLGLVAMEAMSSGTPVLVPTGTGIAELIEDGVSGICYRFDADSLAEALAGLLQNPERKAHFAQNGRVAMLRRFQTKGFDDMWRSMAGGVSGP